MLVFASRRVMGIICLASMHNGWNATMAGQNNDGGGTKKGPSGRSYRGKAGLTRQPKKMRGRKVSSQRWLTRQLNDPFVAEAKSRGFRSRAALKLEQIDDRYKLFKPGMAIVDLGCAPGGWMQVASMRTKLGQGPARLVGIDLLETETIVDADIFVGDMMDEAMLSQVRDAVGGAADGVLSDMAAATTGHRATDHLRTTALLEAALDFALEILNKDGFFWPNVSAVGQSAASSIFCNAILPPCGMLSLRQVDRNLWKAMCLPPAFTASRPRLIKLMRRPTQVMNQRPRNHPIRRAVFPRFRDYDSSGGLDIVRGHRPGGPYSGATTRGTHENS